jgi:DNA recombination-dependent growth factor C
MIPYGKQSINQSDIDAVVNVLKSDWLTTGPAVEKFEFDLQQFTGGVPVVSVSSGTAALHCAYAAAGIGPGDEVITPPLTFIATQATAAMCGAKIVFSDIQPDTGNIDPLQIEEKILPAYVVRQELTAKIKQIEADQQHTLSNKEKLFLKNQIYNDLLLQAFTKISKIYGYFDFANNRLIINSINAKHIELFISLLQKTIDEIDITPLTVKNLTTIMTSWLQQENHPKLLTIENVCVLKDPRKTNNIIRSQGYDLFSKGIKFFLQEGYQVEQIVMTWQDQITFMLKDKFNFASVQYADELINSTKEYQTDTAIERFEVDFIIMTEILTKLFNDLLKIFKKE